MLVCLDMLGTEMDANSPAEGELEYASGEHPLAAFLAMHGIDPSGDDDEDESEDEEWQPHHHDDRWSCTNCTIPNPDENVQCWKCNEHRDSSILEQGFMAVSSEPAGMAYVFVGVCVCVGRGQGLSGIGVIVFLWGLGGFCVVELMALVVVRGVWQIPHVKKIIVNCGVGEASQNAKALEGTIRDIALVTGQKSVVTRSRKAIAGFKLREGVPVGVTLTLRGDVSS